VLTAKRQTAFHFLANSSFSRQSSIEVSVASAEDAWVQFILDGFVLNVSQSLVGAHQLILLLGSLFWAHELWTAATFSNSWHTSRGVHRERGAMFLGTFNGGATSVRGGTAKAFLSTSVVVGGLWNSIPNTVSLLVEPTLGVLQGASNAHHVRSLRKFGAALGVALLLRFKVVRIAPTGRIGKLGALQVVC